MRIQADERMRAEEQMRFQMQKEEQIRIQMQQEEQMRLQLQQEEQMRFQMQQNEMMQQEEKKATKTQVSDAADLEAEKRREYEEWFRAQEKEALEYSACVKYQEKSGEPEGVTVTESQQQSVTTTAAEAKVKTGFSYVLSPLMPVNIPESLTFLSPDCSEENSSFIL
jgi:hypothetical protein